MEKPHPTFINGALLSTGIALGTNGVNAQSSQNTNYQVGNILSGLCQPEVQDISSMSQSYTIKSGDTFSDIALSMGLNYGDFVLYFKEFNPNIDINAVIRVGDVMPDIAAE